MASGNHRKYDIAMQRGSTEKPALFSAVCAGASSPVTGSEFSKATKEATIKIFRTLCPEGWNFHKHAVLAKACFQ